MGEIKQAMIAHLNATAKVFAVFGNRITPDNVPDNQVYPFARLKVISSPRAYTHDVKPTRTILLQVDVYSDTSNGADTARDTIKDALSGYRGMIGDVDAGYVFVDNGLEMWQPEDRNYWRVLEVRIGTND